MHYPACPAFSAASCSSGDSSTPGMGARLKYSTPSHRRACSSSITTMGWRNPNWVRWLRMAASFRGTQARTSTESVAGSAAAPNASGTMPQILGSASFALGLRRLDDFAHDAFRNRDVVEGGRRRAEGTDGGIRPLVNADVVQVPVQAVFGEGNHRGGLMFFDQPHDLGMQLRHVLPSQIAVPVIEDDDVRDAQNGGGLVQLARADASQVAVGHERGIADRSPLAA